MDEVQLTVAWIAAGACLVCGVWAYDTHRKNVAEVERCEAKGGVAMISARGYVCSRERALPDRAETGTPGSVAEGHSTRSAEPTRPEQGSALKEGPSERAEGG